VELAPHSGRKPLVDPAPHLPATLTPASCLTPMPEPSTPTGDAWDPSSRTPQLEGEASSSNAAWDPSSRTPNPQQVYDMTWLSNPWMKGIQVKFGVQGHSNTVYELCNISGDIVNVRDWGNFHTFPMNQVFHINPNCKEDVVVCFHQGDHFGEIFRIKTLEPDTCVLQKASGRHTRDLFTLPTSSLAVIFY